MTQTISNKQLIQTTLETKQTELVAHITRLELVIPSVVTATERQVQETILANERVVLAQVETALHRLEGGTYGYCIDCARAIPEARLKAKPWAIRCIEDEERSEEREREVKTIVVLKPFLTHLSKDLQYMASTSTQDEVRNLVNAYYSKQKDRIGWGNQIRALETQGQPHLLLNWLFENALSAEKEIQKALDAYSRNQVIGQWLRSVPGIGPVIASGLLAHIDIAKAVTAGHIWSFAGLTPDSVWLGREGARTLVNEVLAPYGNLKEVPYEAVCLLAERAHRQPRTLYRLATDTETGRVTRTNLIAATAKRPWNADLKKLCYLIGESFIKVQNNEHDIYGKLYVERKLLEQSANEVLFFADQAEEALQKKHYGKETEAYKWYSIGKLPPAHIHARARRYAVKVFLSHLQAVWFEYTFHTRPVLPYVLTHLSHIHYMSPPNWPLIVDSVATPVELPIDVEPLEVWEDEEGAEEGLEQQGTQLLLPGQANLEQKLAHFHARVEQRFAHKHVERHPWIVATVWGKPRTCKILDGGGAGYLHVLPLQRFGSEPHLEITTIALTDVAEEHQGQVQDYLSTKSAKPASQQLVIVPKSEAPGDHRSLYAKLEAWKASQGRNGHGTV